LPPSETPPPKRYTYWVITGPLSACFYGQGKSEV
jgi:hypothetical protein